MKMLFDIATNFLLQLCFEHHKSAAPRILNYNLLKRCGTPKLFVTQNSELAQVFCKIRICSS